MFGIIDHLVLDAKSASSEFVDAILNSVVCTRDHRPLEHELEITVVSIDKQLATGALRPIKMNHPIDDFPCVCVDQLTAFCVPVVERNAIEEWFPFYR